MPITVDETTVRDILDGDSSDSYGVEVEMAQVLVNDELAPHSDNTERLELTGALVAAAYAKDDGNGPLSSITQGTAQLSFASDSDDALSYWRRATQMDPTGRLVTADKPTASLGVPDVRGGR